MQSEKRIPSLASVMTPFPHAVDCEWEVAKARDMMDRHNFHHLPVTRDGELVGIISPGVLRLAEKLQEAQGTAVKVATIYSPDPCIVDIGTRLDEVAGEMANRHVGTALVVKKGKLVGILTHTDLASVLADTLRKLAPVCGPDEIA